MSDVVYERVADVVWRLAPDRVLVRHATPIASTRGDDDGDDAAADLMGTAALLWVALDEPATAHELEGRLAEEGLDRPGGEVADVARQLVVAGWCRAADAVDG